MERSRFCIVILAISLLVAVGLTATAEEGTQEIVIRIIDHSATKSELDELNQEVSRIIDKVNEEGRYEELASDLINLIGGKHDLFLTLPSLLGYAMTYWMDTLTLIDDNVEQAVSEMNESPENWQKAVSALREAQHAARTMKQFIRDNGGSEQAIESCDTLIDLLQQAQLEAVAIYRYEGYLGLGTLEELRRLAQEIHDTKSELIDALPDVEWGFPPTVPLWELYDAYTAMNASLASALESALDESASGVQLALLLFEDEKHAFARTLNLD